MEYTRKMVLVPQESIEKFQSVNSTEKNFEQLLTTLSSQLLPSVQTPGSPVSRLDAELSSILNENSTNINDKLKQYLEILRRYLFFKNKGQMSDMISEKKIENSELSNSTNPLNNSKDNDLSSILLNTDTQDDNIILPSNTNTGEIKSFDFKNIIEGVPKTYKPLAENILRHIDSSDTGKRLSWDKNGRVILDGYEIPNSNIIDLINDAVRHRKNTKAVGRDFFAVYLKEINTPREFVGNSSFWNKSLTGLHKLPISSSTPKRANNHNSTDDSQSFRSFSHMNTTLQDGGNKKQFYKNSFKWQRL